MKPTAEQYQRANEKLHLALNQANARIKELKTQLDEVTNEKLALEDKLFSVQQNKLDI